MTLDDLAGLEIEEIEREKIPDLIAELARLQAQATARLLSPVVAPQAPSKPSGLLTAKDAAARLKLKVERVYDLCRKGALPHVRVGRQIRIASAALERWIQEGGQPLGGV